MKLTRYWLLVAQLLFAICAADLSEFASEIPACGLTCILNTIPASECKTFSNSTCICTSKSLLAATDECISASCTVIERLKVAKINEKACNIGIQHRRVYDWIGMGLLDILGPIFFVSRIWLRYKMTKKMEIDDWVLVATFVIWIPFTILGVIIRIVAVGYNIWDLDVDTITLALKLFFVDEILYTLTLALLRISILFFLMKIFQPLRVWCWATMAFVITSATIVIFMTLFQCLPLDYNWLGWKGDYAGDVKCINVNALSYAAGASGITQDLIILVLPLPVISMLQMRFKKKIMALAMFSLGIFIVITSSIRLMSLVQFAKSLNPTWDYVDAVLWTSLEVNISVAIVCLPTIRVYLAKKLPNIFGSVVNPSKKSKDSNNSSASRTFPGRNDYADLPDNAARRVAPSSSNPHGWEQDSIELDGKIQATPSVGEHSAGEQSVERLPSVGDDDGITTLIPAHTQGDDIEREAPKRHSLLFKGRS